MKDLTGQQTGGELTAQSFNTGVASELKNLINYAGITLDEAQQQQLIAALNTKWSDINCVNTVVNSNSKVSDNKCSNTDFVYGTTNDTLVSFIINMTYPIGSIFLSGLAGLYPPGHAQSATPIAGIAWEPPEASQGHMLVGAKDTDDWAVNVGDINGDRQVTNPMNPSNLVEHTHDMLPSGGDFYGFSTPGTIGFAATGGGNEAAISSTQSAGSSSPVGIGLTGLKRYGVLIWKRTA